jgi:hypothetical protein
LSPRHFIVLLQIRVRNAGYVMDSHGNTLSLFQLLACSQLVWIFGYQMVCLADMFLAMCSWWRMLFFQLLWSIVYHIIRMYSLYVKTRPNVKAMIAMLFIGIWQQNWWWCFFDKNLLSLGSFLFAVTILNFLCILLS